MSLTLDRSRDDLLLTAEEVLDSWEITNRRLRRLVISGELRRVWRRGHHPFYVLSAVVAVLGEPKHSPTPRYPQGYDSGVNYEEAAA